MTRCDAFGDRNRAGEIYLNLSEVHICGIWGSLADLSVPIKGRSDRIVSAGSLEIQTPGCLCHSWVINDFATDRSLDQIRLL